MLEKNCSTALSSLDKIMVVGGIYILDELFSLIWHMMAWCDINYNLKPNDNFEQSSVDNFITR